MNNIIKFLGRTVLCAALVCPAAVSCTYDDSGLREQIEMLVDKVFALEERMNNEIGALQDLLRGQMFISDVSFNTQTGVTTITLSNGKELQLLPETDLTSMVTYKTSGDVDYWAYIDEKGNKQYFLNDKGEAIPVISEMPKVITKDGETYLVIGGVSHKLVGNSIFSDYELIQDEAGDIYAVTFTFGDNMSFTVTVDGAAGFMFVKTEGFTSVGISEQYIPYGASRKVQYQAYGVVDYVLQVPDGWRVKEYNDPFLGSGFDITAPSEELVEKGIAVGEGELKVVAVLNGGKATVAKLYLTTESFVEFGVSVGRATARKANGLEKFVYGVCKTSDFNADAIYAQALKVMDMYEKFPAGYGITFDDLVGEPLKDIMQADLVPGESYTFWALPAFFDEVEEEYYLEEDTFTKKVFSHVDVKMKIVSHSSRDAVIEIEVKGADAYYFGVQSKERYSIGDLVSTLNVPDYHTSITKLSYSGSAFGLAETEAVVGTEYVAWLAVAEEGKTYSAIDVLTCEFATEDLKPGSTVKVNAAVVETSFDVTADITADGGELIYYAYLTETEAKKHADEAARAKYLLEKGRYTDASKGVSVKATDFSIKMKPEMKVILMALATDSKGMYSEVLYRECVTAPLTYNDLQVVVEELVNSPEKVQLGISVKGGEAVEYLYWIGKATANTWTSNTFLGGSAETAQVYMYLNSGAARFASIAEEYPIVDGVVSMPDLAEGAKHVIVIMAKDKNGLYSKATAFFFTPHSRNLGKIVYKDNSDYEKARPTIEWIPEHFVAAVGMAAVAQYAFNITVPEGFTAYVLCGTDAYLTGDDEDVVLTPEEKMLAVMDMADHAQDTEHNDIFYHYEHGDPLGGFVSGSTVIWGSKEFHDSLCDCGGDFDVEGTNLGRPGTIHHRININDGKPLMVMKHNAMGSKEKVIDRVFVVCQDLEGNCYEVFEKDVPFELFANAKPLD